MDFSVTHTNFMNSRSKKSCHFKGNLGRKKGHLEPKSHLLFYFTTDAYFKILINLLWTKTHLQKWKKKWADIFKNGRCVPNCY